MASVRKNPTVKGTLRWQAVWAERVGGGRTQRRTKNFDTQKEAREHAQRMEIEVERRGIGDPQKHNLERYLKRWIATLADRGEHSPSTLPAYRWQAKIAIRHIGHISLEKLSPADLDQLYATLLRRGGIARKLNADGTKGTPAADPRTVLNVHRVLSNALEQARRWKMIADNPAKDARAPTPGRQRVKSFTADEVQRLLESAANDRETHTIIATLLTTGLRRSELLGLAFDALDFEAGTLTVRRVVLEVDHQPVVREITKTESSERTISVPPILVDLLRTQRAHVLETALRWGKGYRREPMFLFARPDGEPLTSYVANPDVASGNAAGGDQRATPGTRLAAHRRYRAGRLGHRREDGANPAWALDTSNHLGPLRPPEPGTDQAAGEQLGNLINRPPKT